MSTEAIERIFRRMGATYGAQWERSLGATPIADHKTAWAHDLAPFMRDRESMAAIAYALENLPEFPPNLRQFVALCWQKPATAESPALPPPKPDPARVAAELAKLAPMREARQTTNSAEERGAWVRRILARKEAGAKVSPTVVAMAREGLKNLGIAA